MLAQRGSSGRIGVWAALALALLGACSKDPRASSSSATTSSASPAPSASAVAISAPPGDPERGRALVAELECSRCHDGLDAPASTFEKQCFHCHQQILAGTFKPPKRLEKLWHDGVMGLRDVPTLTGSKQRLRRGWIAGFLMNPHDLRPRLGPTMPRLPVSAEQARDIAAFLGAPDDGAPLAGVENANPARGRKLMEAKGCPSCHVLGGAPPFEGAAVIKPGDKTVAAGVALAPDLRNTRERIPPQTVLAWIKAPRSIKPDTEMPDFNLTADEVLDIAAYILTTPLAPVELPPPPARLPVLSRKVGYDEVSAKVFRRTCWHCHGEPDYAVGDGGPGNTGGFGFKPRGLSFVDYGSVASGFTDDQGVRHSVFEPTADGTPRIVAALLARQQEEAGHARADLRGMPLGYPSLSPEDIQLVESWVMQGRPP
jgi:mono/diheme cytochrome c family protein